MVETKEEINTIFERKKKPKVYSDSDREVINYMKRSRIRN